MDLLLQEVIEEEARPQQMKIQLRDQKQRQMKFFDYRNESKGRVV